MNYYFIINPQARNGRSRRQVERLMTEFKRQGLRFEYDLAEGLEAAGALSRQANLAGREAIVAVGGDGTINRVLNGFYDASGRRLSSASMGVIHTGTSPDLCRSYHIPTALVPAVETLVQGRARPISVGRIACLREDQTSLAPSLDRAPRSAYFACCANIGLGARLARLANGGIRRYAGDFLGTFLSLLRILLSYRPQTLRVEQDGLERTLERVHNISIGKTFYIASDIKVRHELQAQDARFYVLCVQNLSWSTVWPVLRALYSGRPIRRSRCLSLEYAQRITVTATRGAVETEFDGDPAGWCPCHIENAPDPLDLITGESVC